MHATLHIQNATIHLGSMPALLGLELRGETSEPAAPQAGASDSEVLRASALTPPALGEYWTGQGGLYVGTVPAMLGMPARHLIASAEEQAQLAWGGYGNDTAEARSHVDGPKNTAALIAEGGHPAAEWAAKHGGGGLTDWHLPSRFDLFMASLQAPQVFEKEGWYWSSTQTSRYGAYIQYFEDGYSSWGAKVNEYRVRAFRWVHFNP